jgi:hypothetical protein
MKDATKVEGIGGKLWETMDFLMVDGIHMMEKEKLITAQDRDVIVMRKITVRIRPNPVGMCQPFGQLYLLWEVFLELA